MKKFDAAFTTSNKFEMEIKTSTCIVVAQGASYKTIRPFCNHEYGGGYSELKANIINQDGPAYHCGHYNEVAYLCMIAVESFIDIRNYFWNLTGEEKKSNAE